MSSSDKKRILVEVIQEPLQLDRYTAFVQDDGAGAIATFTGVTRDNFDGKRVMKLEYEAYAPMATKKLQELCETAHERWALKAAAITHRVGEACAWAIDELKATVPIWKKEVYEGGEVWKENAEARQAALGSSRPV